MTKLTKQTINEIETAFKKIRTVKIKLDGENHEMLSLNEIPQRTMRQFIEKEQNEQFTMFIELIKTCAINPTKTMETLENLTMSEANNFIQQWVEQSR